MIVDVASASASILAGTRQQATKKYPKRATGLTAVGAIQAATTMSFAQAIDYAGLKSEMHVLILEQNALRAPKLYSENDA